MDFENIKDGLDKTTTALENLVSGDTSSEVNLSSIDEPIENPYSSGFDKDHPMPTYDQLRNAGFSDYLANQILYGTHVYSDKELFNALYSPDPVAAYNDMVHAKIEQRQEKYTELNKEIGI